MSEMIYLSGALSTALVIAFSPRLTWAKMYSEMPEARDWSDRYAFAIVSVALLLASLAWPVFWPFKIVRWLTRNN